ncbi:MAG: hypothetical protein RLZZ299_1979 [Pseudomonadota bacterium]
MNVAHWLERRAEEMPLDLAVLSRPENRAISFEDLHARSTRWGHGLRRAGIEPGTRTLVMVRAGVDLVTLTWACFKAGVVPVLLDPGMGIPGFLRCVRQIRPEAFVGIPLAHAVAWSAPSAFESVRTRVTVGEWAIGGPTLESLAREDGRLLHPASPDDEAAVLFTSGSTGPAKGAVYTHRIFDAQVRALRAMYGFEPGEVDCAAFPLFSLFDAALGMTSLIPPVNPSRPGRCDPEEVARCIRAYHATTAFGSPAVWNRVATWCLANAFRLPDLHRIVIAGASVSPDLVLKLRMIMPGEVHTPYGATEALPVASIAGEALVGPRGEAPSGTCVATAHGAGTCVGRPAPGTDVRILPIHDGPMADAPALPSDAIGEIVVAGDVVTRSYAGLPDATARAKIVDADGRTWHRMGDLGRVDDAGRLWFMGRLAERLETTEGLLCTDSVEGTANAVSGRRCALVGVGTRPNQRAVLVVEGRTDGALATRLRAALPRVEAILFRRSMPVDPRHNAKIHRLDLGRWASGRVRLP